jgi:hypothetical protein
MGDYLAHHRPRLLQGHQSDRLWISRFGGDLSSNSIRRQIKLHTEVAFGKPIYPHLFRDCAAYRAAMKVIGNAAAQECGRWLNNRAENSHQPFRRRERAMAKFRNVKTLQKFAAIHAPIHNHFNQDRHLNRRDIFKQNRSAALAEWCQLAA